MFSQIKGELPHFTHKEHLSQWVLLSLWKQLYCLWLWISFVKSEKITLITLKWCHQIGVETYFFFFLYRKPALQTWDVEYESCGHLGGREGLKKDTTCMHLLEMLDSVFLDFDSYWGLNILASAASVLTIFKSVSCEFSSFFGSAILNHWSTPFKPWTNTQSMWFRHQRLPFVSCLLPTVKDVFCFLSS